MLLNHILKMINYGEDTKKLFLSPSGWFNDELWDTPHKANSMRTKFIKHVIPSVFKLIKIKIIQMEKYMNCTEN